MHRVTDQTASPRQPKRPLGRKGAAIMSLDVIPQEPSGGNSEYAGFDVKAGSKFNAFTCWPVTPRPRLLLSSRGAGSTP